MCKYYFLPSHLILGFFVLFCLQFRRTCQYNSTCILLPLMESNLELYDSMLRFFCNLLLGSVVYLSIPIVQPYLVYRVFLCSLTRFENQCFSALCLGTGRNERGSYQARSYQNQLMLSFYILLLYHPQCFHYLLTDYIFDGQYLKRIF